VSAYKPLLFGVRWFESINGQASLVFRHLFPGYFHHGNGDYRTCRQHWAYLRAPSASHQSARSSEEVLAMQETLPTGKYFLHHEFPLSTEIQVHSLETISTSYN